MATPIWEEPARGFYVDPASFLRLSGLDLMRGFTEGRALPPPIHYLTGLQPTFVAPGACTFTLPVTDWLLSPQGAVSASALCLLVDGPLGCTIQTTLPPATPYTTSELSISYLRPAPPGGTLAGRGRLLHAGRVVGLSAVEVVDERGRPIAEASTRCVLLPKVEVEAPPELPEPAEEPSWPSPPPYLRPVQGGVVPQATWDRLSGLEVMQGHLSGEIPAPPLTYLTGLWPVAAAEGRMTWRMPASEWLCGPLQGQLYGGATAFLAGTAIDGAVQTTVPAGTAFAPVDLKVYFLRPVPPDGRLLLAESQIVHRGRTTAIATAEVRNADGKVVALATGSSMILPGRPASLARG